jgi:cation-transporting ATPase E
MKSIETLARVNVLCVDKTGTITENSMAVHDYMPLNKTKKSSLKDMLGDFCHAQAADNATMVALKNHFVDFGDRKVESVSAFSSEYKYSGVNYVDGKSLILGAPEFVLRDDFEKYKNEINEQSEKGYRVLVFGEYGEKLAGKKLHEKVKPLGLVLLSNPVRENAAETFEFFAQQGVDIKVISGDNPVTVSEVAKLAKIKGADKYIDASTLDTDELIADAMRRYTVFGRVTPEQKQKFVRALQADKKVVAMTGDGVNDVLALRDADCSVAMASGSDAAVQAAQVVLLESDFSRMPEVVAEGRRVVNNLERSGSLFLVKNVFSILTSIVAMIFVVKYPLVPAQISLVSMFTIGLPGFLLSQAPNRDLIKGHFVTNILKRAIPGGLASAFLIAVMMFVGSVFSVDEADASTACTIIIAVVGMFMVARAAKPIDWYKKIVVWVCAIGLFLCYAFLPNVFNMTRMSFQAILICVALVALVKPVLDKMIQLTEWIWLVVEKFIANAKKYIQDNKIEFVNPFQKN